MSRGRDTKPEVLVRSFLHRMGFRFRNRRRNLPGNPDIVLARHTSVIFVHGCFWHGHKHCQRANRPATHISFWNKKLDQNIDRDKRFRKMLRRMDWKVLVLSKCRQESPRRSSLNWKGFYLVSRRKKQSQPDPEALRRKIEGLVQTSNQSLDRGIFRRKVLALIPIFHGLRNLGKALIPGLINLRRVIRFSIFPQIPPHNH